MFVDVDGTKPRASMPSAALGYGRFMQSDPIGYGDGLNWYNYVGSDPVNASDSSGLSYTAPGGIGHNCDIDGNHCDDIVVNGYGSYHDMPFGGGGLGSTICDRNCSGVGPVYGTNPSMFDGGGDNNQPSKDDIVVTGRRYRTVQVFPNSDGTFQCSFYGGPNVIFTASNNIPHFDSLDVKLKTFNASSDGGVQPNAEPEGYEGSPRAVNLAPYSKMDIIYKNPRPASGMYFYEANGRTYEETATGADSSMNIRIQTDGGNGGCR